MVMRKKREGCPCICDAYLTKFQPKGSYSLFLLCSVYFVTACLDELGRETKHLDFQVRDHHNVKRENSSVRTKESRFYEPARLSTPSESLFSLKPLDATTWLRSLLSKIFRKTEWKDVNNRYHSGVLTSWTSTTSKLSAIAEVYIV